MMPYKPGKALAFAVLIWIVGFIWGSVVFMTPALKSLPSIPYVSRYPAISFPILVIWPFVTYLLARNYLKTAPDKPNEGLKLGITFTVVNLLLDLLVLVILFGNDLSYFASLSILVANLMLVLVPWWVGKKVQSPMSKV
jgi:hypothetical protein